MTQARLAAKAGVALDTLRALEAGKNASPGVFLVADLAAVLKVKLDVLTRSE